MRHLGLAIAGVLCLTGVLVGGTQALNPPGGVDPGPRVAAPGAGGALLGLSEYESGLFDLGADEFAEVETVADGLGPRFNLDSCAGCHAHPGMGGSSPAVNPQVAVATAQGALNAVPSFISLNGPVREVRFQRNPDGTPDGGVHALFVISGRSDAQDCAIQQEDFESQAQRGNAVFRIPTPVFGAGLVESISDRAILANMSAQGIMKRALGISGRPNRSGNDGTITRFGWKAQNKSLLVFSGEAYSVEQGVSNEMFPQEREEACQYGPLPNDTSLGGLPSGIERFAFFMRYLAPPEPAPDTPSIARGRALFSTVGCALCHTPALQTGWAASPALSGQPAALYSDLLLHAMGPGLADGVAQGAARGDEFRTAPLWGLGQRLFFLHDGRTSNLVQAIRAHASLGNRNYGPSEANAVVGRYLSLPPMGQQDLLNFLRSL
jgi:CxxC motif-containing protein (DUF1111 family)